MPDLGLDYTETVMKLPLEREFEGWIMHDIDCYLSKTPFDYHLFGIGNEESEIGSDEAFTIGQYYNWAKFAGIQFKRPKFRESDENNNTESDTDLSEPCDYDQNQFDKIKWRFDQSQFSTISDNEIVYGLPTFLNRNVRSNALNHCIFWNPKSADDPNTMTGWYGEPPKQSNSDIKFLREKWRWGDLMEQFLNCNFGKNIEDFPEDINEIVDDYYSEEDNPDGNPDGEEGGSGEELSDDSVLYGMILGKRSEDFNFKNPTGISTGVPTI